MAKDRGEKRSLKDACEYFNQVYEDISRGDWSQVAVLMVNIFAIITLLIALFTVFGLWAYWSGRLDLNVLLNPFYCIALVLVIAGIISIAVYVINRQYIILPVRAMLKALGELGHGNFDVRVELDDGNAAGHPSREVKQFVEDFNATAEALGSLEVMRSGFVDDFSHEFKTPIVSISGFAQLLCEDDVDDEERKEYAQIIYDESKRLASMASDILLLRQAESTTLLGETELVDVAEAVRRAAIALRGKWAEKDLNLELDLGPEDAPAVVDGSPALLDRAVANLLDNACKFSPEGGRVCATLTAGEGADPGTGPDASLCLTIENDGPVIGEAALGHIFERFYQADPSHATQGAGLGLPLVARVAELHGGRVAAASTAAGHTTFTLELPLAR